MFYLGLCNTLRPVYPCFAARPEPADGSKHAHAFAVVYFRLGTAVIYLRWFAYAYLRLLTLTYVYVNVTSSDCNEISGENEKSGRSRFFHLPPK